jgi:hypothetical protein
MSLSDLASLGSFVSGFAVLVSLIYLALQVRQAERNQQALIHQGRAARVSELILRVSDPTLAAVYSRVSRGEDVTGVELAQFRAYCMAAITGWEDTFFQHEQRLLDDKSFASLVRTMKIALASSGMRVVWKSERNRYEDSFRAFVDEMVRESKPRRPRDDLAEWKSAIAAELETAV